jgi:polysaccharide export outer membrane protein
MQITTSTMFKLGLLTLFLLGNCANLLGEQERKSPPKELIQYIREATGLGLKDAQIQENAVRAGWPAAIVTESITQVRSATPPVEETRATPSTAPAATSANEAVPAPVRAAPAARPTPSSIPPERSSTAGQPPTQPQQSASRGLPEGYHIGAGDVLQISVWKEPEASVGSAVVRPDGKIGLPLLKEVDVLGLTPTEAEQLITSRLSKLIPAADVTVVVTGINSKKIYIVGAVKKEGPIAYTYRMTVMQAISEAGGLNDYAKRKKIYILRPENGKDYKLPFDYEAALKGERMELNIPLLPGDTLVVPH